MHKNETHDIWEEKENEKKERKNERNGTNLFSICPIYLFVLLSPHSHLKTSKVYQFNFSIYNICSVAIIFISKFITIKSMPWLRCTKISSENFRFWNSSSTNLLNSTNWYLNRSVSHGEFVVRNEIEIKDFPAVCRFSSFPSTQKEKQFSSPQDPLHVVEYFDSAANKLAYRYVTQAYAVDCLLSDECECRVFDRL